MKEADPHGIRLSLYSFAYCLSDLQLFSPPHFFFFLLGGLRPKFTVTAPSATSIS